LLLVVAAMECRTIVAAVSGLPGLAVLVVSGAGTAERGLVLVLGIEEATLVLDSGETGHHRDDLGVR